MRAGKRRFTSIFLALVMVLTLLPSTAFAAEPEESTKPAVTEDVTEKKEASEEQDSKKTKETKETAETKEATEKTETKETTETTETKESSDLQEDKQAQETKQAEQKDEEKAASYTVEVLLPEAGEGEPSLKTAEKSGALKQSVKDGGVFQDIVLVYEVSDEELASYTEEEKEALSAQVKAWAEALNTALADTGLQAAYQAAEKGEDGSETPESIVISGTPTKDVQVDVEEILANCENPQELADEKTAVYVAAAEDESSSTVVGSDTTGNGTKESPYATISKAYTEVANGGTIYLLTDLNESKAVTFTQNKSVIITSADADEIKTIYSSVQFGYANRWLFNICAGSVTFTNITLDGKNQKNNKQYIAPGAVVASTSGTETVVATLEKGTTIQNFKKDTGTDSSGAVVKAASKNSVVNIKTGSLIKDCQLLSGNTSDPSSVVSSGSGGILNMSGGKITGNTLSSTQENTTAIVNIGMINNPHFWMTDGEITGNTINKGCAAVYMRGEANACDMQFGDTAYVYGNYVNGTDGEQKNIYLKNDSNGAENPNVYIKLCSALTGSAKLGVYAEKIGMGTKVAQGTTESQTPENSTPTNTLYTATSDDTSYFVSDKETGADIVYCGGNENSCGLLAHSTVSPAHGKAVYLSYGTKATGTKGTGDTVEIKMDRCTTDSTYVILDKDMKPVKNATLTDGTMDTSKNDGTFKLTAGDNNNSTIKVSGLSKDDGPYTVMLLGEDSLTVDTTTGKAQTSNLTDIATINAVNFEGDGVKWTDSTDSTKSFSAGDFDVITVPHNDQTGKANKTYIATTETGYTFKEETTDTAVITGKLNDATNIALTDTQLTTIRESDKKYTVKVTVPAYGTTSSGTDNYNSVTLTGSTGVSCGVTLKTHEGGENMDQGKTYDGKAVAYQQGGVAGAALSYTWQKKENASDPTSNYQDMATGTVPTDAGEYNLKVEAKKGSNVIGTQNLPFTISAKQVTANVTVADKTYDGNNTATITKVELTGVEEADKTKVSLSTDGVTATFNDAEAGDSKTVTVEGLAQKTLTGEKAQNYALTQNCTTNKPSITKADGLGAVTLNNWTYGNSASTPTVTSSTNDTENVTYQYKAKDAADTEYTSTVPTKAGEYTVQATFAETTNYKTATATADFEIYKKDLLVQVSAMDKVYDGTTKAKLSTAKLEEGSVVDGDEVTLVTNGVTASFDTAEAGTKKNVTLKGDYTLTGADAANYTVSNPRSLSADITQAEGKATVTLAGWTYGDTPKTPGVTSTTNGTNGVTYRYKVKGASTYLTGVPTDAGEYEIEAIFPAADNYKAVTATATFTIQPKALTVTVTAQDKTYDGNDTATLNTPTLNGVLEADKTAVTLNTTNVKAVFADKNVGDNKAITVTGYALNGNEKGNYTLTQPTGLTASIKSKPSSSSSSGSSSSSSSSADTAVSSARTADESPIVLWLALLLISAGACAVVLGKKKYHK